MSKTLIASAKNTGQNDSAWRQKHESLHNFRLATIQSNQPKSSNSLLHTLVGWWHTFDHLCVIHTDISHLNICVFSHTVYNITQDSTVHRVKGQQSSSECDAGFWGYQFWACKYYSSYHGQECANRFAKWKKDMITLHGIALVISSFTQLIKWKIINGNECVNVLGQAHLCSFVRTWLLSSCAFKDCKDLHSADRHILDWEISFRKRWG